MSSYIINGMTNNLGDILINYVQELYESPSNLILLVVDVGLVVLLFIKLFKIVKDSRAWQLLKGMLIIMIVMALSSVLKLTILNYILTSFMTYGLFLVVLFQPELRRSLEELGSFLE